MIKNERQYAVAANKLAGLEQSRTAASDSDKAAWRAYTDLIDDLHWQMEQYAQIKAGQITKFDLACLDDLGEALIKARIRKGWTQAGLAEQLDVSEQLVQRDESRDYENAGLARLAEILDVLEYELVGEIRPKVQLKPEYYGGSTASNGPSVTFGGPDRAGRDHWVGSDSFRLAGTGAVLERA